MYFGLLSAGILVSFFLFGLLNQKHGQPWAMTMLSLVLSLLLGFVFAKAGYCLLLADTELFGYGLESLLSFMPYEFSVFCGALGVVLGVFLSARIFRCFSLDLMDRFAPIGALILSFIRFGEYTLGTLGAGPMIPETHYLARFPWGLPNSFGEWHVAICVFEGVLALLCGVCFLLFYCLPPQKKEGSTFRWTVFFLALPQILCESLRARCMKWGFVRIEQLLCGLLILFLVCMACRRRTQAKPQRRFLPVAGTVLAILLVVFVEFALDKLPLSTPLCYALMLLAMLFMTWMEWLATR